MYAKYYHISGKKTPKKQNIIGSRLENPKCKMKCVITENYYLWPLSGNCLKDNLVYKASVEFECIQVKIYIRSTKRHLKLKLHNHNR